MDILIKLLADALLVPLVIIAVVAIWRLPSAKRWQAVARGAVASLTALWLAKVAAQFYQGVRPFVEMGVEPGASFLPNPGFPSDHALLAFSTVFVVFAATQHRKLSLFLLVLAVLVASGRVLALVHTPADVIGSFVCAALAAFLWYGIFLKQNYYTNK